MEQPRAPEQDTIATVFLNEKATDSLGSFSRELTRHRGKALHQLTLVADGPMVNGIWNVRIIPDTTDIPDTVSIATGETIAFGGADTATLIFPAALRGIVLENTEAPSSGQLLTAIMISVPGMLHRDVSGGGGPVGDHGGLSGLLDDDHPQYLNQARGDLLYSRSADLAGGELDVRYYTEAEVDALIAAIPGGGTYFERTGVDVTGFTYVSGGDADGAYETITFDDAVVLTFAYTSGDPDPNLNGLLSSVTDGDTKTVTIGYDAQGRFDTVTYA